ncbi:MAG TPA: PHP domain-containing protein, partial [Limnochordia bacterium]
MRIDYHMHLINDGHTGRCPYTRERIEAYVAAARARGVDEIGITEHDHRFTAFRPVLDYLLAPEVAERYPSQVEWLSRYFTEDLGEYVEALVSAQERGLPVKVGIEVDYAPGREEALRAALADHPWDYVLGSVHFVGTWA